MVKYEGSGSTVSRSSTGSHRSDDPTVHPRSSSGRAHSEVSNNMQMVPYKGNSSSSGAPSQASRSSSHRSRSSSASRSHYSSSGGRDVARRDTGRMDTIAEEPREKSLKDATVRELLDEAERKDPMAKLVFVPVFYPVYGLYYR